MAKIIAICKSEKKGTKKEITAAVAYVSGVAALLFDIVSHNNANGRVNDEVRAAIEAGCQEI